MPCYLSPPRCGAVADGGAGSRGRRAGRRELTPLIRLSAFEGTQLPTATRCRWTPTGGTGFDKIGCTVRQPVGVVVAITPFDFPSRLVLHKIGPAPAAGNAGVLKPARSTPLTALALAACFVDAGLPEGVLSVLTVPGRLARRPAPDPPGRKVSFSGLTGIGERIAARTGVSGTPPT